MLIDDFMPNFEFGSDSKIDANAAPEAVFRAVKSFNMGESTTIRWLFKMRGIPTENLTLKDFDKAGFKILGEKPNGEIVLGLIGEFKTLTGGLVKIEADKFKDFNTAGFVKAVWNFNLIQMAAGKTRVTSEIRVIGTDAPSAAKIQKFWGMIKPPAGMISNEILKLIKKQAEAEAKGKR